jgi:hypothetical protein
MMYGIEMWGLDGGRKEIDKTHSRFCTKITVGVPRFAEINVAELEFRDSTRGKVLNTIE